MIDHKEMCTNTPLALSSPTWFQKSNVYSVDDVKKTNTFIKYTNNDVTAPAMDEPASTGSPHNIEQPNAPSVSGMRSHTESSNLQDESAPLHDRTILHLSRDTLHELRDHVAASLASLDQSTLPAIPSTIIIANSQENTSHVARRLVLDLAKQQDASMIVLDLEDLYDLAEDFNEQLKASTAHDAPAALYKTSSDEASCHDGIKVNTSPYSSAPSIEASSAAKTIHQAGTNATAVAKMHDGSASETRDEAQRPDGMQDSHGIPTDGAVSAVETSALLPSDHKDSNRLEHKDSTSRDKPGEDSASSESSESDHATESSTESDEHCSPDQEASTELLEIFFVDNGKSDSADTAKQRRSAAMDAILGCTGLQEHALFVFFELTSIFSSKILRKLARFVQAQIQLRRAAGCKIVLFVSTTSCELQHKHEYSWDAGFDYFKNFDTDEHGIVHVYGKHIEDPHCKYRAEMRQLYRALRRRLPVKLQQELRLTDDQLATISECASVLENGIDATFRLLIGRAARQHNITFDDIAEVMRRSLRRANEAKNNSTSIEESGISYMDAALDNNNDYDEVLRKCKVDASRITETFDDVILDDTTLQTIKQLLIVALLPPSKSQNKFLKQLQVPGIILHGPPGTGKTQLVRAIANSISANMVAVEGADIQTKWVGESENRVRAAFKLARQCHPCVLFIDEADSLFYRRADDDRSWQRSLLNQFLAEMDGLVTSEKKPLVIVATNRFDDIDDAVLRRLPHHVKFSLPDVEARIRILELHLKGIVYDDDVDISALATVAAGFSGSDLRNLCQQAMLADLSERYAGKDLAAEAGTLKEADLSPRMEHFLDAIVRIKPGAARLVKLQKTGVSSAQRYGRIWSELKNRMSASEVQSVIWWLTLLLVLSSQWSVLSVLVVLFPGMALLLWLHYNH